MDLHRLRCAVAIAEHGSFTRAASALRISQPALSYAIGRLERELGTRLFDRTAAGARPTAAGEAFMEPARRAVNESESAKAAVDLVTGVLSGDLRIVTIRTAVVETANHAAAFHRRHPGVRMVIEEPTRDRGVVELVRSGRCDVGVLRAEEAPDDLPADPAGGQEVVIIFPEAIAPAKTTLTLDDLRGVPLIIPLPGTLERLGHDELFQGREAPHVVAECSHQGTMVELVRGGAGAAMMAGSLVGTLDRSGIVARSVQPLGPSRLVAVRRETASPAAEAFGAVVRDESA